MHALEQAPSRCVSFLARKIDMILPGLKRYLIVTVAVRQGLEQGYERLVTPGAILAVRPCGAHRFNFGLWREIAKNQFGVWHRLPAKAVTYCVNVGLWLAYGLQVASARH